jgi:imidazolonepropionase
MPEFKLVTNCKQLLTCSQTGHGPKSGGAQANVGLIENGSLLFSDERIVWVGETKEFERDNPHVTVAETLDASEMVITPGLVDPHTHPVFAATREDEFYLRNAGKSYMEIAEAGGGIRNSVRKLRGTPKERLVAIGKRYLDRMMQSGTTTIEAKSGYGLSTEAEIKSLEVIQQLDSEHPIDLVPTFLGAHEFPDEYRDNRDGYIDLLVNEMIPEVASRKLAEFCDIFTEAGVYDIEQSRRVMEAARQHGFGLKFHADELKSVGGAELAAELGAISADHLVHISERGIAMMAEAGTVAVLLPATTLFLGHTEYAPARKMIAAGVPIAIATDFNPGSSFTTSLPVSMTIAAIFLKMSAAEIFCAVTYNAAYSIGRQSEIGSLEAGKQADFVLWGVDSFQQIPYSFGQKVVSRVYKKGRRVI